MRRHRLLLAILLAAGCATPPASHRADTAPTVETQTVRGTDRYRVITDGLGWRFAPAVFCSE